MSAKQPIPSLVKRHMRTVIIVFAVVITINIVVMSWFFISKRPAKTNPLWNYIPNNIQQAILIDSSKLLDILDDTIGTVSNNPVYKTLTTSNNIAILQF